MDFFKYAVIAGSFSKTLSLAGERVGYLAINPAIEEAETLMSALTVANRVLGFVNAPIVGQKLVLSALGEQVELDIYRRRREAMRKVLADAGLEFYVPEGAFYFFPKSPVADDSKFVAALVKERVLAVSGAGFGMPGYVRFSFCVPEEVIKNAAAGIAAAVKACREG
jgi:aspartate aminotransferase